MSGTVPYIPRILHVSANIQSLISATRTDLAEQNLLVSLEEIRLFRIAGCDRPNGPRLAVCFSPSNCPGRALTTCVSLVFDLPFRRPYTVHGLFCSSTDRLGSFQAVEYLQHLV